MSLEDKKDLQNQNNVIAFARDERVLNEIAEERLSEGDYVGALSVYLDIEAGGKFNPVLYQKIADLYTQLNENSESVNYWFKYLNCVTKRHYVEAYNGLGANFLMLEEHAHAAYYFNLQINDKFDSELPYDDYMYDLFSDMEKEDFPQLKLVDWQGERDAEQIKRAKELYSSDQEGASNLLNSIQPESSQYGEAQCLLAAFCLLDERYEDAIVAYRNCLNLAEAKEYALNNLYALYLLTQKDEKAEGVYNKLIKLKCGNFDHLVKYLLLFDAKDMHELNYYYSKKMYALSDFSPNLYYILGVSAFNVGKYQEAKQNFALYNSVIRNGFSKWCCKITEDAQTGVKGALKRINYSYYLPEKECEKLSKQAEKLLNLSGSAIKKRSAIILEFAENCFATKRIDLQLIACQLLSLLGNTKAEKCLKALLLKSGIDDSVKSFILTMLVDMGNNKPTGLVFGNIYVKVKFERVEFNEGHSEIFKAAYSYVFGKLAPLFNDQIYKIKVSAYDFYYKLLSNGNLRKVNDVQALAALIAIKSDMTISSNEDFLIEYFSTDRKKINKILRLIEAE